MKPQSHIYPPVAPPPHSHKMRDIEGLMKALFSAQGPIHVVDGQLGVPLFEMENTAEDAYTLLKATGVLKGAFHYMEATNDGYIAIQGSGPDSGWGVGRVGDDGINLYVDPDNTGLVQGLHIDATTKQVTLFGVLDMNTQKISNLVDPTLAQDAATKAYVDGIAVNLGKRATVRVATTANITIATALNNGDTLDGVTLATGDLVLVKNQSTTNQNGIYVVGASPARDAQFDTYNEHPGSLIVVQEGTTNADTVWLCTSNAGGTLNTTAIAFSQMTVSGALLASNNLSDLANAATARTNLGLGNVDNTSDATKNSASATLTNKTLTNPVIAQINDANGNETLILEATASAVNELTIKNNITANAPQIKASGGDTNISVNIVPKGTGALLVAGVTVPTVSSTSTFTNKRITKRVVTTNAPGATPTTNSDNTDIRELTGLNAAITSMTTNLSGTPSNGDFMEFIFVDDGTARAITWGASFANGGLVNLPTTTVISTALRVLVQYQTIASLNKWVCVSVA